MADVGRPTKLKEEYIEQACRLVSNGATRKALAVFFGVPDSTIYNWCKISEKFKTTLEKASKDFADRGSIISSDVAKIMNSEEYISRVEKARPVKARSNAKKYNTTVGKVEACLRARLYDAVKGRKKERQIKGLPFTVLELIQHIEVKFRDGMNWENYGKWHIDHIRPCASFNQFDKSDFTECWSLENLQPLWAKENLSKGARYECANGQ